ncbi:MBG domain-containing protein [Lysobacter sp. LF1]|uniref:MBG domain-containing protein n=1 Tax=Lysobacter stagni TaxID=3045172 RepID=A0ABT6XJ53_9GAMM|nr:MBG domain-containing protein [Lysobacter sp. LF1]MDI9240109.1 MBG domain-containing protein [Lysobacter sp. LF1]
MVATKARPRLRIGRLCVSILAHLAVLASATALAEEAGARLQSGNVTVNRDGTDTRVTQATARAVADWSSFDVLANESVTFVQPDATSAILNRIHSATPSRIDGSLFAPGRVILQNANGIMFSGSARVDVGSLVATSLQVNAEKFLESGALALGGPFNPDAVVGNAGTISAADRGLVALIGGHVDNSGLIQARLGTVALGAGSVATIDFGNDGLVQVAITDPLTQAPTQAGAMISNTGRLSADGGSVLLSARSAGGLVSRSINLDGVIEARGVAQHAGTVRLTGGDAGTVSLGPRALIDASGPSGGTVVTTGRAVDLAEGARILAIGNAGNGGTIRLGGDFRGQGNLPHADTTTVARGALLDASGYGGSGGSVILWSDGLTTFDGAIRAQSHGGAGGLVETSSTGVLNVGDGAIVSTASTIGHAGTWLLDPDVLQIVGSGGSASTPGQANLGTGVSSINASAIVSALAGGKVQLVASNLISVDAPIIATMLGGFPTPGLELIGEGPNADVSVNAPILLENGHLAIRAAGDIRLGTDNPGATDFEHRAIIAVGNGTVWMETPEAGSITQAANSAVLANNLALISGSVDVGSTDNFALNLAGEALDGEFVFRAKTTVPLANLIGGTVWDPFVATRSLSGVTETQLTKVGEQNIQATAFPDFVNVTVPDTPLALDPDGGGDAQFDTIVLSALPYLQGDPGTTDSSDFAIRRLSYQIGGELHDIAPETLDAASPTGFELIPINGRLVTTYILINGQPLFSNQAWGIDYFGADVGGTDTDEIGFHPVDHVSEELMVRLGGSVSRVDAVYRMFLRDDFNGLTEQAHVDFYRSVQGTPTIDVSPAPLTGTASSFTRTYGDPNPTLTFAAGPDAYLAVDQYLASQLPDVYPLPQPILVTDARIDSSVGQYPINIEIPSPDEFVSQRYSRQFTPGTLTINPAELLVAANDKFRLYGEENPPFTWTTTGWRNGDQSHLSVLASLSTPATPASNVGEYPINVDSAALSDPLNRNYVIVTMPGTLTITASPLLLVAADDKTRMYGAPNPEFTFTVSGWRGGDESSNAVTATLQSPATLLSNVGEYPILVSSALLAGPAAGNYMIRTQDGVLFIVPAPLTVTADHLSKTFGSIDPRLTYVVSGLRGNDTAAGVLTGVPIREAGENVGVYAVMQGSIDLRTPNYELSFVDGSLRILPAPLEVIAYPASKVYGDVDPELFFRVYGLQLGHSPEDVLAGGVARDPGEKVGIYPIGLGSLSLLNSNYVMNFTGSLFTILAPPHQLSADARFYNTWRLRDFERGRDPDTPADAVYRTTRFENPYIPDPLMRAYALGRVWTETASPTAQALASEDWLERDNDRTGQHADRTGSPRAPCAAFTLHVWPACGADRLLRDFWQRAAQ